MEEGVFSRCDILFTNSRLPERGMNQTESWTRTSSDSECRPLGLSEDGVPVLMVLSGLVGCLPCVPSFSSCVRLIPKPCAVAPSASVPAYHR